MGKKKPRIPTTADLKEFLGENKDVAVGIEGLTGLTGDQQVRLSAALEQLASRLSSLLTEIPRTKEEMLAFLLTPNGYPVAGTVWRNLHAELDRMVRIDGRLRSEQRRIGRSRGGRGGQRGGIMAFVERELRTDAGLTAAALCEALPEADGRDSIRLDGFELYRDGNEIVEIDLATNRERSIKKRQFREYVRRVRRTLEEEKRAAAGK
jgi:hypothetical protein